MPPNRIPLPPQTLRIRTTPRDFTSLPSTYNYTPNLAPGTIVGIVLGSVLGFLLVIYLLYLSLNSGRKFSPSTTVGGGSTILSPSSEESRSEIIVEENLSSRSPGTRSHRHSRRGGGRRRRREEIEEEEYIPPSAHRHHPEMVEGSALSSERSDMVTVLEEHSSVEGRKPPRRARGAGGHGKGYRAVDLDAPEGLSVDGSLRS
ncbi:uncharacterized protein BO97DRAFT_424102 [Aspergillus homomorphus CBS 101889]|uniref:Uncharacterized protein n=1 Tax=Aspergillus homomorphus (strain CBS 101889) TaxID=1450537 RepID=A0A395HYB1_ASPHC|nr:hypothetical protein BO97DRAFT_424102 [Aspergillus homomorphus CBS 101889]RAL12922.1 hypothetical protein BO97DRAFT_424102 [Aspergillus homomorphus CBS 101889]